MTSSLVGSEMCIRDREVSVSVRTKPAARGALGLDEHGGRVPVPATPVSYTHLTLPTICSV
eukprot:12133054-Prorocentrum_lima.AAC.1